MFMLNPNRSSSAVASLPSKGSYTVLFFSAVHSLHPLAAAGMQAEIMCGPAFANEGKMKDKRRKLAFASLYY